MVEFWDIDIKKIDEEMSIHVEYFKKYAQTLNFIEACQFTLNKDIELISGYNYSGLYLFEIESTNSYDTSKEWLDNFQEKWGHHEYLRKFVPNIKKKRILKHPIIYDWIPIYIGKSKNIGGRINEHIFLDIEKTTFALKLLARKNLHGSKIKISTIKLEVKNYDLIMPKIESFLRDRINPILGKQ